MSELAVRPQDPDNIRNVENVNKGDKASKKGDAKDALSRFMEAVFSMGEVIEKVFIEIGKATELRTNMVRQINLQQEAAGRDIPTGSSPDDIAKRDRLNRRISELDSVKQGANDLLRAGGTLINTLQSANLGLNKDLGDLLNNAMRLSQAILRQ